MKKIIIFFSVIFGLSFNSFALNGNYSIHDPSGIIKCGNKYWIFGTGYGIFAMYSSDLVNWATGTTPFASGTYPSWVKSYVPSFGGHFWAPECFFMNGKYYLYYSCSSWGSRNSCIGLITNETLDPQSPDYEWSDEGVVIYSTESNNYNCIDPAVFRDNDGRIWLSFGSHWDGIKMTEIDSVWGTPLNETIYSVASKGDNKAEASYIINHGGFYYLFVNHGQCCDGVNSTYYITMGRSESQTGPYLDKTGKDLYNGGGTTVFSTSGSFIGPGCSGYYIENGKEWFTCHYYDGNNYGQAMLCIARIQWDENNWPVIKWNWIDNGVYSIANKNSNLVWDISGTGEDRDPVIQKQYARSASQQWDFYWLGNGTYEISASGNGLLAKITDCMGNAGAKISIGEALSYDCEKWVIDRTNDASFIFTSLYGGKVAEVPDFSMEENVQLEMNNYTGAANQKWILWDTARGVHVQGLSAMQNGIRVFPNPSQGGNFMIETDQNSGICEIMVYSLDGRNINHEELAVKQIINVKNTLTPGIYIVKVKINSYFLTFKLNVY